MTIENLMTQPVTIVRAANQTDRYNNTIPNWSSTVSTPTLAWIAQRSADELLGARDGAVSEWVGFFRIDVTIGIRDRVVRGATTFEVAGPVNPANTPHGGLHHFEVPLRVVEG